jgi:hypothetical protein
MPKNSNHRLTIFFDTDEEKEMCKMFFWHIKNKTDENFSIILRKSLMEYNNAIEKEKSN